MEGSAGDVGGVNRTVESWRTAVVNFASDTLKTIGTFENRYGDSAMIDEATKAQERAILAGRQSLALRERELAIRQQIAHLNEDEVEASRLQAQINYEDRQRAIMHAAGDVSLNPGDAQRVSESSARLRDAEIAAAERERSERRDEQRERFRASELGIEESIARFEKREADAERLAAQARFEQRESAFVEMAKKGELSSEQLKRVREMNRRLFDLDAVYDPKHSYSGIGGGVGDAMIRAAVVGGGPTISDRDTREAQRVTRQQLDEQRRQTEQLKKIADNTGKGKAATFAP